MVELVVGIIVLVLVLVVVGIYLSDRKGWNQTLRRVSRMGRAQLESRKELALERRKDKHQPLLAEWDKEFTGKAVEPVTEAVHVIVKLDYASGVHNSDYWPRWTCKCGAKAYRVVTGDLRAMERAARRDGEAHVKEATRQDGIKASGSNFMF